MERLPWLGCHADGQRVEVGLIRCLTVKAQVRPSAVVKVQIAADRLPRLADAVVGPQVDLLYLTLRHSRSTNTLSRQAPLPSMLMAMPLAVSTPMKAWPVNCEPWSVLKISGLPWHARASCSVSMQNAASMVMDNRHDNTRRVAQSSAAAR